MKLHIWENRARLVVKGNAGPASFYDAPGALSSNNSAHDFTAPGMWYLPFSEWLEKK